MYPISKNMKNDKKSRWVLLEHLPTILSPKILVLIFLYAMAFTLLLLGARILHFEHILSDAASSLTSVPRIEDAELLYQQETAEQMQENIASKVIRLHVIANSDTDSDQELKLMVRDTVIHDLQEHLAAAVSVEDARNIILSRLPLVREMAADTVRKQGYDYLVKAGLQTQYFPVKTYGDLSFPSGNYEALCITIGAAKGHNWWCVLFPSLCFVNETYAVVPEESKERLKHSLTAEEYDALEIHSAIYDSLN